jgi:hypothetical protein
MQWHRSLVGTMDSRDDAARGPRDTPDTQDTYNPWTIVHVVFHHLAAEGLHPVLGESGDPGKPAADLLRALGLTPAFESRPHVVTGVSDELARLREAFEARSKG